MYLLNRGGSGSSRRGFAPLRWSGLWMGLMLFWVHWEGWSAGHDGRGPTYGGSWWSPHLRAHDLRSRWYSPREGCFLSPDSFEGFPERPASQHRYAYAEGDPINRVDPSGHTSLSDVLLSGQVRVYLASQNTGPMVTSAKLGMGLLTMAAAVNDPESFLSAMESPNAAMELAVRNFAFVAHYGRRSVQFLAGYLAAHWKIQPVVEKTLWIAAQRIRRLDPNAVVGFRGSVARGYKGAHKNNDPFKPGRFDVDGFIVSDVIAADVSVGRAGARFVHFGASPELLSIQADVDAALRVELSGMNSQRFTFRVFTTREFLKRRAGAVVLEP